MIGPLNVKVLEAHIPDLSEVGKTYWKYDWQKHELEGLGYFCPRCGNSQIIKLPVVHEETGMLAWD